jgi:hypothetical protein
MQALINLEMIISLLKALAFKGGKKLSETLIDITRKKPLPSQFSLSHTRAKVVLEISKNLTN